MERLYFLFCDTLNCKTTVKKPLTTSDIEKSRQRREHVMFVRHLSIAILYRPNDIVRARERLEQHRTGRPRTLTQISILAGEIGGIFGAVLVVPERILRVYLDPDEETE